MRRFLFAILFIGTSFKICAQYVEETTKDTTRIPRLMLKAIPSYHISLFPSYVFEAEYAFNDRVSIATKFGSVYNQTTNSYDDVYYRNKSGFKSAITAKFYFQKSEAVNLIQFCNFSS